MIERGYRYQLFLDGLPIAMDEVDDQHKINRVDYDEAFFVGKRKEDGTIVLYNHLVFRGYMHDVHGGDERRIVGFEGEQYSIDSGEDPNKWISKTHRELVLRDASGKYMDHKEGILFTYSRIAIKNDNMKWKNRYDHYYNFGRFDVHMKQILISVAIMAACTITAIGYVKTSVTRDFALLQTDISGRSSSRNN